MSRLSKFLLVTLVVVFMLACNLVTQPIKDAQNLAGTAQSLATAMPIQTLQKGIPIMTQATVGQEFSKNNTYSFKAPVTIKEVQDFYNEKLTALGWTQSFNLPSEGDAGLMVFQKDNNTLTITITSSEGSAVVLLTLA